MADWTTPISQSDGDIQSAFLWNTHVVENIKHLKAELERYYACSQEVTAKEAVTVYQNTTAKIRIVTVTVLGNAGTWGRALAFCEADETPSIIVAYCATDRAVDPDYYLTYATMTFVVPIDSYYKVTLNNNTIHKWVEWDLH